MRMNWKVFFTIYLLGNVLYSFTLKAQDCTAQKMFSQVEVDCLPIDNHLYCVKLEVTDFEDASGNPLRHTWVFGDGQLKPGHFVEHCYSDYGEYDILLITQKTVSGVTFSDTTHFPLSVGEVALIQEIKDDRFQYFFDGSGAFINKDYKIINYYWDFGDGHYACGMLVNNRYTQAGEYEVRLIVEGESIDGDRKIICGRKTIGIR